MDRSHEFDEALLVFPSLEGSALLGTHAAPRWIDGVLAKIRAWRHVARSRFELNELDDRQLKDIGVTRSQALIEGRKFFWQS